MFWIKGCGAGAAVRESRTENLELQQRFNVSAVLRAAMQAGASTESIYSTHEIFYHFNHQLIDLSVLADRHWYRFSPVGASAEDAFR